MATKTIEILSCDQCGKDLKEPQSGALLIGTHRTIGGGGVDAAGFLLVGGENPKKDASILKPEERKLEHIALCKACFLGRLPKDWLETPEVHALRAELATTKRYLEDANRYMANYDSDLHKSGSITGRPLPGPRGPVAAGLKVGTGWGEG